MQETIMQKTKNDLPQIPRENQPAVGLIALGVIALLVTGGFIGELFGLVFGFVGGLLGTIFGTLGGLIGTIFGFVGELIGTIFGFIGGMMGLIFGTLGGFIGLFFGTMMIWLPLLLIVGGIIMVTRNSHDEKVKNEFL